MPYFFLLIFLFFGRVGETFDYHLEYQKATKTEIISKEKVVPVEKVKPPEEKIKPREKRKNKKKQKSPDKTQEIDVSSIILISVLVLFLVGAFIFGFGIFSLAMIITGLILMGIGNVLALIWAIFMAAVSTENGSGPGIAFLAIISFVYLAIQGLMNLIVGLAFLIWGLIIATPLVWIVGLILLAILIALVILCLIAAFNL